MRKEDVEKLIRLRKGFRLRCTSSVTGRRDLPSSDYGMAGKGSKKQK